MAGGLAGWQDDPEQIGGLAFTQPHGAGRGGKLALPGRIQRRLLLRLSLQFGNPPLEPLDLKLLCPELSLVPGGLSQPLFHLASMLVDRLTAAL
jgi:hypothetical protein